MTKAKTTNLKRDLKTLRAALKRITQDIAAPIMQEIAADALARVGHRRA